MKIFTKPKEPLLEQKTELPTFSFSKDRLDRLLPQLGVGQPSTFCTPDEDQLKVKTESCGLVVDASRILLIQGVNLATALETLQEEKQLDDHCIQNALKICTGQDEHPETLKNLRAAYSQNPALFMFKLAFSQLSDEMMEYFTVRAEKNKTLYLTLDKNGSVSFDVFSTVCFLQMETEGLRPTETEEYPYHIRFKMKNGAKPGFELEHLSTSSPVVAAICSGQLTEILEWNLTLRNQDLHEQLQQKIDRLRKNVDEILYDSPCKGLLELQNLMLTAGNIIHTPETLFDEWMSAWERGCHYAIKQGEKIQIPSKAHLLKKLCAEQRSLSIFKSTLKSLLDKIFGKGFVNEQLKRQATLTNDSSLYQKIG